MEPETYSRNLGSHRVCLAKFWTCLGPITLSCFPMSPFGTGPSLMPVSLLCFGRILIVWFHVVTAGGGFYLRVNPNLDLTYM